MGGILRYAAHQNVAKLRLFQAGAAVRLVAEQQVVLLAVKRVARLVAQVVHAREELTVQDERQVASHGGQRQLVAVVGGERAMRAVERHLRRQQALDAAAELLLEVVLVQAQLIEVQKEIVTGQVALAHDALAH